MKYLVITTVLCFILAGASFAGEVTMTDIITGGGLTLTMPENFSMPDVPLGGHSAFAATEDAVYAVEDSRGTGVGWNVGIQISPFATVGTPTRTIDTSRMRILSVSCVYGQNVDDVNGPVSLIYLGYYTINAVEKKVIRSNANYGMGKYSFQPTHYLIVEAFDYAGTYTATLTATLNAVP